MIRTIFSELFCQLLGDFGLINDEEIEYRSEFFTVPDKLIIVRKDNVEGDHGSDVLFCQNVAEHDLLEHHTNQVDVQA